MPFYAKDWRSPGESWIKTEDGWEKLKVLETNRKRLISEDGVFYRLVILYNLLSFPNSFVCVFSVAMTFICSIGAHFTCPMTPRPMAKLPWSWCNHHDFLLWKAKPKCELRLVLSLSGSSIYFLFFFFLHGKNNRMWGRYTPCFPLRSLSWIVFIYFYQLLHWRVRDELKTVRSLKILWMLANLITTLSF